MDPDDPIFEMIRRAVENAERRMSEHSGHIDDNEDMDTPEGYLAHHIKHVESMLLDAMDKAEEVHASDEPDEDHEKFVFGMQKRHIDNIVESVSAILRDANAYLSLMTNTVEPSDASEEDVDHE